MPVSKILKIAPFVFGEVIIFVLSVKEDFTYTRDSALLNALQILLLMESKPFV
jgi:hypothetical protein